jgi:hypothetical protein
MIMNAMVMPRSASSESSRLAAAAGGDCADAAVKLGWAIKLTPLVMATPYAFIGIFANAVFANQSHLFPARLSRSTGAQAQKSPDLDSIRASCVRSRQRPVDSSLAAFYFVRVTFTVVECTTLPEVPVTVMA